MNRSAVALSLPVEEDEVVRLKHYLHTGHLFASAQPAIVTTILGSCVSVCLYDATVGVGGLNHYLLPHRIDASSPNARFGSLATIELIARVEALGARRRSLRAKIFGGSAIISSLDASLGRLNAELAVDMLREERIVVVGMDTGGPRGRKIVFHTDTGEALVRFL